MASTRTDGCALICCSGIAYGYITLDEEGELPSVYVRVEQHELWCHVAQAVLAEHA